MPLQPGRKFGSYEVLNLLGAGGMGEVYRARDTMLKRDVAIKALPDAFSRDPERISRFQREAEVLASLSHPNIAAILHLEEVDGARFLVLELVEGETLAERIARGRLPVDEAIRIAKQIADAMEAAHAKGIVHRDLKPANVKITPEGKVKVLDFGLAKIYEPEPEAGKFSQSPTLVSGTMAGALLGTAGYMSPEQARGQNADHQSDVWAFGCILYEMLTGKSSFQGGTMADIFGSIVKGEPDWTSLPKETPGPVVLVLRRCLQKERARRMRSIGDAGLEIDEASIATAAPSPKRGTSYAWIVAAMALVAAVVAVMSSRNRLEPVQQQIRFTIPPPQRFFVRGSVAEFALSPDGRYLAFIAEDATRKIWLRALDSTDARPLMGTENARTVFWSPDSRYIGFVTGQRLAKMSISDGQLQVISDVGGYPLATWNRDNVIVFSIDDKLFRVSGDGGAPEPLTPEDGARGNAPHFLPDGDHLLFVRGGEDPAVRGVWVTSLKSSERKRLLPFVVRVAYSPTGHLLYVRDEKLFAQAFDLDKLDIGGDPLVLANQVGINASVGDFHLSSNGILAWSARPSGAAELVWRDRTGQKTKAPLGPGLYRQLRLSPNATRAAVAVSSYIWILEMSTGIFSRLTSTTGQENDMVWSPDGRELAFMWRNNLYRKVIGAQETNPVIESNENKWLHDWSPDGRFLVFAHDTGVYTIPLSGKGPEMKLLENSFGKDEFRVSPDNKWIAYNSDESGRTEVYVASFPSMNNRRQVSNSGGAIPRWRGDMREMYYMRLDGALMAVDVRAGDALETGPPQVLFQAQVPVSSVLDQYDVTGDGKRFLVIENEENAASPPINVIVNWATGLSKSTQR